MPNIVWNNIKQDFPVVLIKYKDKRPTAPTKSNIIDLPFVNQIENLHF